ncbi:hypothetical protein LFL97_11840 [Burkholderia sp. JSH-S8]|nr:hypothetical protein [Burkholderia stagnalis]WGS43987.1 hypothetical protein LFL97_11840 [Burkholderia sp. JSH-S8]
MRGYRARQQRAGDAAAETKTLGISRATLYRHIAKHRIVTPHRA